MPYWRPGFRQSAASYKITQFGGILKFIIAILSFLVISFALMSDADAGKRLGGGKSTGIQRDSVQRDAGTVPKPATPPTQAAPAGTSLAAPPMPAPSGASRWLGPLAGLAAGGLLASLFMGSGFDGIKLMDILLIGGLLFVGLSLFRMMMRNRAGR